MKKGLFAILAFVFSIIFITTCSVNNIEFKRECKDYLQVSAQAPTVETASLYLDKAISYLEKENLTSGSTSVIWYTPNEDIGIWYKQLKQTQDNLHINKSIHPADQAVVLLKLKEVLISKHDSEIITRPTGIQRFPNNGLWGFFMWLTAFSFLSSIVLFILWVEDYLS